MNSNEENNFENQWREAFADASEQPSTALWGRIEQQLDINDIKNRPLWYNYLKYAAAGLVLVVLGGYWTIRNQQKQISATIQPIENRIIESKIAVESQVIEKVNIEKSTGNTEQKPSLKSDNHTGIVLVNPQKIDGKRAAGFKSNIGRAARAYRSSSANVLYSKKNDSNKLKNIATQSTVAVETYGIRLQQTIKTQLNLATIEKNKKIPQINSLPENKQNQTVLVSELDITNLKNLIEPIQNQLVIPIKGNKVVETIAKKRGHWVNFGLSLASFNPHISLPPSNNWLPYSYSNIQQKPTPTNLNEGTIPSFLVRISAGIKIKKRLGVESGIGFLIANSVYETSTLTVDNQQVSAIADALSNSALLNNLSNKQLNAQPSGVFSPVPATNGNFGTQKVRNDYQFIQIPVLMSYDVVSPARKINVAAVIGVTSSMMLQNQIQTINRQDIVYKNSTYTPYNRFSFSATFGLRGSYKLSKNWAMALTVDYQKAIQSIEKPNIYFTAKPQLLGLGLGAQHRF